MNFCDYLDNKMFTAPVKKRVPLLKKRSDEWEHEKREQHSRVQSFSHGDRFIPRRFMANKCEFNEKFLYKAKFRDILLTKLSTGYWRNENLKLMINEMFGIKNCRLLQFNGLSLESDRYPKLQNDFIFGRKNGLDWPCKPRSKPLVFVDTSHDIPGFDIFSDLNVIDWSVSGQIAASFGRDLVLWDLETDVTMVYKIKKSRAVSYSPDGRYLGVGCQKLDWPVFELWSMKNYKDHTLIQNGHVFSHKSFDVRCIEWDKTGKKVVCGTEFGTVFIFSVPKLDILHTFKHYNKPCFSIKLSPNSRYLATCDIEGNIYIYNWTTYDVHCLLKSSRKLRAVLDWHPWNGTDLAISEDLPASIVILNVPTREIVAYYQRKDFNCQIDSITFSKLSAELVVSYAIINSESCVHSEILVMSSLDRIVDVLQSLESSVRFMMWSPNGMKLATAANDETLTIWNFFTSRHSKNTPKPFVKKKLFKYSSEPAYEQIFSRMSRLR